MLPLRPRVFIASSCQSKLLADELAATLDGSDEVCAESWARPDDSENNRQLLGTLIKRSKTYDFAVVILTGDDVRSDVRGGEEVKVPRANCIFELGLFIGAFGGPERCFLLSSMEPRVLFEQLSDIGGQLYQRLEPPKDFTNKVQCRVAAKRHRDRILDVVRTHKRFVDRPRLPGLGVEDILEREEGDAVKCDSVVLVKESQPIESKLRYASIVMRNMRRPVNYLYLFGSDSDNHPTIIDMIRSLLAAAVVPKWEVESYDQYDEEEKKAWLEGGGEELSAAIRRLRRHLFIELIDDVEFDEFCIHSAGKKGGQGYVKIAHLEDHGQGHVPIDRYVPIPIDKALLRYKHEAYKAKKGWPTQVIFEPDALDEIEEASIADRIRDKFPEELHEELIAACFARQESSTKGKGKRGSKTKTKTKRKRKRGSKTKSSRP